MEGDKVDIALKTNREFSVPFCVTLTTSDGSAVGEFVVALLMYLFRQCMAILSMCTYYVESQ